MRALGSALALAATALVAAQSDPCVEIAGETWVTPAQVRACYSSFPVNETEKANVRIITLCRTRLTGLQIIEVVNKTLAFHTSVNYQLKAPAPYDTVHEDLLVDLARISNQDYASDYDLHIDVSRTLKRLNDGHCVWVNYCYDCESNQTVANLVSNPP